MRVTRSTPFAILCLALVVACDGENPVVSPAPSAGPSWKRLDGSITRYFQSCWISPSGRILASGNSGTFWFDGTEWEREPWPPGLNDIQGFSDRNVFAVAGAIFHYDGAAWKVESGGSYRAIWGADAEHMYAVGMGGEISKRQGTSWVSMPSPTSWHLWDMWGSSNRQAFAVGDRGRIVEFDGVELRNVESNVENSLRGIWGSSSNDVYAVGDGGVATHFDGKTWSPVETGTSASLLAIAGSADAIYAVGVNGTVLRIRDGVWTPMETGTRMWLHTIAVGARSGDAIVAGDEGTMLTLKDGVWNPVFSGMERTYMGIASSTNGAAFACGYDYAGGMVRSRSHDGNWNQTTTQPMIVDVWAYDEARAFAIPYAGDTILRYTGGEWDGLPFVGLSRFESLSGFGSDEIVVAHDDTLVSWFDGSQWRTSEVPLAEGRLADIQALGNTTVAAGYHGEIFEFVGGAWQPIGDLEFASSLSGNSHSDIWVTSDQQLWHFDGDYWSFYEPQPWGRWQDVAVSGADAYAVSIDGMIAHFNGSDWIVEDSPAVAGLNAVSVFGGRVYAAGDLGALLVRDISR